MFYQKFQQEGNNSRGDKRQHQGWWQELAPTAGCAPTTVPSEAWTRPLFPRKGKGAGGSSTSHVVFICLQYFKPIGTTRSLETFPSLFFSSNIFGKRASRISQIWGWYKKQDLMPCRRADPFTSWCEHISCILHRGTAVPITAGSQGSLTAHLWWTKWQLHRHY